MDVRSVTLAILVLATAAFALAAPGGVLEALAPWVWAFAVAGVTAAVAFAVNPALAKKADEAKVRGGLALFAALAMAVIGSVVAQVPADATMTHRVPLLFLLGFTTVGVGASLLLDAASVPGAKKFQDMLSIPELRSKLLATFGLLVVYRLGFFITLPGVDQEMVARILEQQRLGGIGGLLAFAGAITGGALRQCVVFALGIMPYISASIIFSLLAKVIPALEQLQKEGASGRQKITQYTRFTTVGLCIFQGIILTSWMMQPMGDGYLVRPEVATIGWRIQTVMALTAGGMFLMWLGEQITEHGVGNGISLLIMTGIIARMPSAFGTFIHDIIKMAPEAGRAQTTQQALKLLTIWILFVAVVICVVAMQQSQRRIPIQHAKHARGRKVYGGQRHYLPLRINAAGVMPVIFAQSLLILPAAAFQMFSATQGLADVFYRQEGFLYYSMTIVLVGFFTYFWVSLMFNPVEMSNNMKEYGSIIPGIRPGRNTAEYLEGIMNRITFVGAGFLAAISLFPLIMAAVLDVQFYLTDFLGGTGILIVVGVALDVVQKVESHLLMRHYEGFMKRGRVKGRL